MRKEAYVAGRRAVLLSHAVLQPTAATNEDLTLMFLHLYANLSSNNNEHHHTLQRKKLFCGLKKKNFLIIHDASINNYINSNG